MSPLYFPVLCLVGNKCDLVDGRQVQTEEAQEYADSIDALFFETSALKNTGAYSTSCISHLVISTLENTGKFICSPKMQVGTLYRLYHLEYPHSFLRPPTLKTQVYSLVVLNEPNLFEVCYKYSIDALFFEMALKNTGIFICSPVCAKPQIGVKSVSMSLSNILNKKMWLTLTVVF